MTHTEIRMEIKKRTDVGFTTKEAFRALRDSISMRGKKEKLADKIADMKEKSGSLEYGFSGKEYGNRKWG
jgi:hypothetical protein